MPRMRRSLTAAAVIACTLAIGVSSTATASAAVVPVNPGAIGAGKPIVGTGENLPTLGATATYHAGPGFADQINAYYKGGSAAKDQAAVAAAARKSIRNYIDQQCGGQASTCKTMLVFDVDDTLFSTYPQAAAATPAFGDDADAWVAAVEDCSQPVIQPVADLWNEARKLGVAVAIVTGRSQQYRDETVACLREAGVTGWYELVTRSDANANVPASEYKARQRTAWEKKGFTIIGSIGDQVSDMALGHTRRGFLLPNPMYLIP